MSYNLITPTYELLGLGEVEAIRRTQEITPEFLTNCHDNRVASNHLPMGEFHQFASIPVAVVEHWMRLGFDVYKEPMKAILKRLHDEDLTAFLTTDKSL